MVGDGGAGRPPGEQVAQKRLQVGPAGAREAEAAGGQERLGLAGGDQVGGHRLVGAVLGAQVPLEGAQQRAGRGRVHSRRTSTVKRSPSVMRLAGPPPNAKLTSVAAGQSGCGGRDRV